ncbi:MAG: hypothetical protein QM628_02705 [Propionicimonas sp.]
MSQENPRRPSVAPLVLASSVLVFFGLAGTAAAFTDHALLNLGAGGAIGNPNLFDIAIRDANGDLQDAATTADAVILPLTSGDVLSETNAVVFEAHVVNRDPGVAGDLLLRLYDPDEESGDVFADLRFTIYLDGASTAAAQGLTAAEVNAADLGFTEVDPGDEHTIRVSALLASGTAAAAEDKSTQIGLRVEGESR